MLTWIIYDISDDNARNRVAKQCQRSGLYRVQESVFLGCLESPRLSELLLLFETWIQPETDRIYLVPLSLDDFEKMRVVGKDFDRRLVTDQINELFF
ncbi:CRISPR-associated endonuclease Cas2 [Myxococcota bacterium]|nr:CRISPR-associated endonuclease Cas2 [Myxococcota bacterium]